MQVRARYHHQQYDVSFGTRSAILPTPPPPPSGSLFLQTQKLNFQRISLGLSCANICSKRRSSSSSIMRTKPGTVASSSSASGSASLWDGWKPEKSSTAAPSLSDILWPAAGAFAAMAIFGKMDQILAPRGISTTIAPLGAVSAVLFITPSSPAARKYNMFMAQIGCAAIGVIAFSVFGTSWLARSVALSASIAFMIYTRSAHPPAASLPLLFIDGAKFHHLNIWYALFPGATGCIVLCLIQEIVCYLKDSIKF